MCRSGCCGSTAELPMWALSPKPRLWLLTKWIASNQKMRVSAWSNHGIFVFIFSDSAPLGNWRQNEPKEACAAVRNASCHVSLSARTPLLLLVVMALLSCLAAWWWLRQDFVKQYRMYGRCLAPLCGTNIFSKLQNNCGWFSSGFPVVFRSIGLRCSKGLLAKESKGPMSRDDVGQSRLSTCIQWAPKWLVPYRSCQVSWILDMSCWRIHLKRTLHLTRHIFSMLFKFSRLSARFNNSARTKKRWHSLGFKMKSKGWRLWEKTLSRRQTGIFCSKSRWRFWWRLFFIYFFGVKRPAFWRLKTKASWSSELSLVESLSDRKSKNRRKTRLLKIRKHASKLLKPQALSRTELRAEHGGAATLQTQGALWMWDYWKDMAGNVKCNLRCAPPPFGFWFWVMCTLQYRAKKWQFSASMLWFKKGQRRTAKESTKRHHWNKRQLHAICHR